MHCDCLLNPLSKAEGDTFPEFFNPTRPEVYTSRFVLPHSLRRQGPTIIISFYRLGDLGNDSNLLLFSDGNVGLNEIKAYKILPFGLHSAVGKYWTWESIWDYILTFPKRTHPLTSLRLGSHLLSTLKLQSRPCSPQLEEVLAQQRRPSAAINKSINLKHTHTHKLWVLVEKRRLNRCDNLTECTEAITYGLRIKCS